MHQKVLTIPNCSAGFALIWGLCVLNPFTDIFARYPILYSPMYSLVPDEMFWGVLFGGTGLIAWILAYFGKPYLAALVLTVALASFSALYFIGDYVSVGGPLYGWLSLCNFLYWGARKWNLNH